MLLRLSLVSLAVEFDVISVNGVERFERSHGMDLACGEAGGLLGGLPGEAGGRVRRGLDGVARVCGDAPPTVRFARLVAPRLHSAGHRAAGGCALWVACAPEAVTLPARWHLCRLARDRVGGGAGSY